MFKDVRHAYSVLSDPHERSWYDSHREDILRGGDGTVQSDEEEDDGPYNRGGYGGDGSGMGGRRPPKPKTPKGPNIFSYYARNAYSDFDDSPKGFFTVFKVRFC